MVQTSGYTATAITQTPQTANITTAIRAFLLAIVPPDTPVQLAQQNRTVAPSGPFALVTLLNRQPLATVAQTDTATTSRFCLPEDVTVQVSLFGPGAGNNAQRLAILFRTPWACQFFETLTTAQDSPQAETGLTVADWLANPSSPSNAAAHASASTATETGIQNGPVITPARIAPLYTSAPRQAPFISGERQFEEHWLLDLHCQVNTLITLPTIMAPAASVALVQAETVTDKPTP
ncbi:phage neck terminator protein [Acetobacter indonesiensis]|uniref:Phage neck terminator protein gp12-like domain-containing protein n=1 Tax=Acetobacter indonesiensis TaxID=104101 RepID=A0A252AUJ8_9PROT|nr:hypothetical protein [Acetobacter indonesiensis]OUI93976.1 hypothetical protein HK17_06800 [Acetobacter indonesiensis]